MVWATERRDVLSGFFFLLTVLCYLKSATGEKAGDRSFWLIASLLAYSLSLLSKATGMTVPVVLLVLDAYPLRRLGLGFRDWFDRRTRQVWLEKVPFFLLGIAAGVIALFAQREIQALARSETYGFAQRLAQAVYRAVFYLWKTIWPVGLAPLYPIPNLFDPLSWPYLLAGSPLSRLRSRSSWHGGNGQRPWQAGFDYVVVVAPVLGFAQSGVQFVADRYTYLSCLSWEVLSTRCSRLLRTRPPAIRWNQG